MQSKKKIFPKIKKKLHSFLTDESGKITKKDALGLSAWVALLWWVSSAEASLGIWERELFVPPEGSINSYPIDEPITSFPITGETFIDEAVWTNATHIQVSWFDCGHQSGIVNGHFSSKPVLSRITWVAETQLVVDTIQAVQTDILDKYYEKKIELITDIDQSDILWTHTTDDSDELPDATFWSEYSTWWTDVLETPLYETDYNLVIQDSWLLIQEVTESGLGDNSYSFPSPYSNFQNESWVDFSFEDFPKTVYSLETSQAPGFVITTSGVEAWYDANYSFSSPYDTLDAYTEVVANTTFETSYETRVTSAQTIDTQTIPDTDTYEYQDLDAQSWAEVESTNTWTGMITYELKTLNGELIDSDTLDWTQWDTQATYISSLSQDIKDLWYESWSEISYDENPVSTVYELQTTAASGIEIDTKELEETPGSYDFWSEYNGWTTVNADDQSEVIYRLETDGFTSGDSIDTLIIDSWESDQISTTQWEYETRAESMFWFDYSDWTEIESSIDIRNTRYDLVSIVPKGTVLETSSGTEVRVDETYTDLYGVTGLENWAQNVITRSDDVNSLTAFNGTVLTDVQYTATPDRDISSTWSIDLPYVNIDQTSVRLEDVTKNASLSYTDDLGNTISAIDNGEKCSHLSSLVAGHYSSIPQTTSQLVETEITINEGPAS